MRELISYSRMRISFTSTSNIDINLFCNFETLKMKLSVNQKKKKKKRKKEKRKIAINRRTTLFKKKRPVQRFITLTFNARLFPSFLSMSLKKISTISDNFAIQSDLSQPPEFFNKGREEKVHKPNCHSHDCGASVRAFCMAC